ncbi:hypothetical protein DM02DRAFT_519094 [Periconia macrospinosa]|uniref:Uncharacterized protein n=1 Tax=Periconia macrospinosa TaxID=97972 RepID=A0A2V1E480_9PLEO|nr:hypothetical protein DM02DRAFT_519094 [Periconia macrospinosa]
MTEEEVKNFWSTKYEHSSKKPMKEPLTAPLDMTISEADVEKIKVGYRTRSMDEKWDFLIEDPDESGNISLHILRSWLGTQDDDYILHIAPKPSNNDGGSAKIVGITWEGNKAGLQCDAEQAKIEAVSLCRGHLKCKFDNLPDYPTSMFWKNYKKLNEKLDTA